MHNATMTIKSSDSTSTNREKNPVIGGDGNCTTLQTKTHSRLVPRATVGSECEMDGEEIQADHSNLMHKPQVLTTNELAAPIPIAEV